MGFGSEKGGGTNEGFGGNDSNGTSGNGSSSSGRGSANGEGGGGSTSNSSGNGSSSSGRGSSNGEGGGGSTGNSGGSSPGGESNGNSNSGSSRGGEGGGGSTTSAGSGYGSGSTGGNSNSPNAGGMSPTGNAGGSKSGGGFASALGKSINTRGPGISGSLNAGSYGLMGNTAPDYDPRSPMANSATPPTNYSNAAPTRSVSTSSVAANGAAPLGSGVSFQAAAFDRISRVEGTSGPRGYDTLFGGAIMDLSTGATTWGSLRDWQDAQTKNKKAAGKHQMMPSTIDDFMRQTGVKRSDPVTTATQDDFRDWAFDRRVGLAERMAGGLTPENLASQLANEWAGLAAGPDNRSAYQGDVAGNKAHNSWADTVDIAANYISGMNGTVSTNASSMQSYAGGKTPASGFASMPSTGPSIDTNRATAQAANRMDEAKSFSDKYMAGVKSSYANYPSAYTRNAVPAGYTPADITAMPAQNGRRASAVSATEGMPAGAITGPFNGNPTAAAAPGFNTNPSPAPGVGMATSAPAAPAQISTTPNQASPQAPAAPAETAKKGLGIGGKIAAGLVDAIAGINPVGSVVNAGLMLTGHDTLGTTMVGDFLSGNSKGPDARADGSIGGEGEQVNSDGQSGGDPLGEVSKPSEFISRYLTGDYGKKFETPAEKWGGSRMLETPQVG